MKDSQSVDQTAENDEEEFDVIVKEGIAGRAAKREKDAKFDEDWLTAKEKIRVVFQAAVNALKRNKISASICDPYGDISLEAANCKLSCGKGDLVVEITSSFRPSVRETFGVDLPLSEVRCRVKKFLREVAEKEPPATATIGPIGFMKRSIS